MVKNKSKFKKSKTSKLGRSIPHGRVYVQATYNNTIVTITDQTGNVLSWCSAGQAHFRGPKKSTPYAAGIITNKALEKAQKYNLQEVDVFVKGVGSGRDAAVRALYANRLDILSIKDVTGVPHNGCRPPKSRRV